MKKIVILSLLLSVGGLRAEPELSPEVQKVLSECSPRALELVSKVANAFVKTGDKVTEVATSIGSTVSAHPVVATVGVVGGVGSMIVVKDMYNKLSKRDKSRVKDALFVVGFLTAECALGAYLMSLEPPSYT